MPIVSSSVSSEGTQRDGRRWVHEAHTDHLGFVHARAYLAANGENVQENLAAYAVLIEARLTANEIAANVASVVAFGSQATTVLNYSGAAANFAALRVAYQTATRIEAVMIGDFLSSLTDANLRNAFNMTAQQVTNLRSAKLTPAANLAASIRATTGQ